MRQVLFPLLLCPTVALSQGACPMGSDMANGITFGIDGVATELYKPEGPDRVSVVYSADDGYQSRILLGKGVYLLEFAELSDGLVDTSTRTTYSHSLPPQDMPLPKPEGRWVSQVAVLESGTPSKEVHNHKFGPLTELTIGTCSYDMIPVTVYYDDDQYTIDHLEYLPEFGIAILAGSAYDDDDGERQEDVYTYTSIAAERGGSGSKGGKKGKKGE